MAAQAPEKRSQARQKSTRRRRPQCRKKPDDYDETTMMMMMIVNGRQPRGRLGTVVRTAFFVFFFASFRDVRDDGTYPLHTPEAFNSRRLRVL